MRGSVVHPPLTDHGSRITRHASGSETTDTRTVTGRVTGTVAHAGAVTGAVAVGVHAGAVAGVVDAGRVARRVAGRVTGVVPGVLPSHQVVQDVRGRGGPELDGGVTGGGSWKKCKGSE